MSEEDKKEKFDLYALKRKINKEKRVLRNKILGTDTVDGSSMMRTYTEATKTRRALKIQMFGSKSKASKYGDDTSIETFVKEILDRNNIEYIEQKAIRYINVDFYLPKYNLAIEAAGDYWHVNPRLYPEPKNSIQRKNIEKDKTSEEVVLSKGVKRLVIWEQDIKHNENLEMTFLDFLNSIDSREVKSYSSETW